LPTAVGTLFVKRLAALGAHDWEGVGAAEAPLLADRLARRALRVVLVQENVGLRKIRFA
jgi:hypothetical protein